MPEVIKINPKDSVAVALQEIVAGDKIDIDGVILTAINTIPTGHKIALIDIKSGDNIIKYGEAIGHATANIMVGEHVHTNNTSTNLAGLLEYAYKPRGASLPMIDDQRTFDGYLRDNGDVGIRNEIWIIPTVGCVNKTAERLASLAEKEITGKVDGFHAFVHPYGCSQLGDDHKTTQRILANLAMHPNAGGVLIVGLGCENNHIAEFKEVLGNYDPQRIKFVNAQDEGDEYERGLLLLNELADFSAGFSRQPFPISKLKVGLKCGGSDAFSGITANPLTGEFSDMLVSRGGTTVLTEVPEMFGAEHLLMERCNAKDIFTECVDLINDFKDYYIKHNQVVYDNPSPGNKAGGITTLEEKSLGCTQKSGTGPVADVLPYGGILKHTGLNLLSGPGNDIVAVTALAAAGVHIILFTTGRGTPLGAPVPTVKISTNNNLAKNKPNWIDFNAGELLTGTNMVEMREIFFDYVLSVANGGKTKNEVNDFREIAIFKDGVTL
jgi:altronate hydrolase